MTAERTERLDGQRVSDETLSRWIDYNRANGWTNIDADIKLDLQDARATIAERDKEIERLRAALAKRRQDRKLPGIREAVTMLHERATEMSDPHARDVLHSAALYVGERAARPAA